jgi:3-oxoacyl-[acyl-carrier protein] reductase
MELRDRVALVTGGGTGLGRAIALALAQEGCHLTIGYSRSEHEATATVDALEALGVRAVAERADLGEPTACRQLVSATLERHGRLDVLVNNAGTTVYVPFPALDQLDVEQWDRVMAVNLRAPWLLAQAAAPALRAVGGCILNTASIAGFRTGGSSIVYCVSKAGLIHLTRCLATALAPAVRVNAIAPGFLRTRWGEAFGEETLRAIEESTLLRRSLALEDVAAAALSLIRNEAITGQTLVVDGGMVLH